MLKIQSSINNIKSIGYQAKKTVKYFKTALIEKDVFIKDSIDKSCSFIDKLRKFFGLTPKLNPASFVDKNFNSVQNLVPSKYSTVLSKSYLDYNYLSQNKKIVNGFKDGGRYSKVFKSGKIIESEREIITIDKKNDVYLKNAIAYAKKNTKNLSSFKKMKFLFNMVNDIGGNAEKGMNLSGYWANELKGKEILLGKMFELEATCCRHKALMFKILGDEVGLKTRLLRGKLIDFTGDCCGHTWNEVLINKKRYVVDVQNGLISKTNPNNIFKMFMLRDYFTNDGKHIY